MKKLSQKELNTLESSIKEYIEYICDEAYHRNNEEGTCYSVAYVLFGFQAIGNPDYYLELEGDKFWKELITEMCRAYRFLHSKSDERNFLIHIVSEAVGYKNMVYIVSHFKDKEGFNQEDLFVFLFENRIPGEE